MCHNKMSFSRPLKFCISEVPEIFQNFMRTSIPLQKTKEQYAIIKKGK